MSVPGKSDLMYWELVKELWREELIAMFVQSIATLEYFD